jgi:hypothetical protein
VESSGLSEQIILPIVVQKMSKWYRYQLLPFISKISTSLTFG